VYIQPIRCDISGSCRKVDENYAVLGYFATLKVKAIPLQAWTGPEGFRRLRLPDFKTIGA
jgi:hypothetical protein